LDDISPLLLLFKLLFFNLVLLEFKDI